jgi:hypothetical protein
MALAIAKHIELQTNISIRNFIHEYKKITDARLKDQITGKEIRIRANLTNNTAEILRQLNMLT